ncbi:hypothetical protein YC2023_099218 [Brassica napus]
MDETKLNCMAVLRRFLAAVNGVDNAPASGRVRVCSGAGGTASHLFPSLSRFASSSSHPLPSALLELSVYGEFPALASRVRSLVRLCSTGFGGSAQSRQLESLGVLIFTSVCSAFDAGVLGLQVVACGSLWCCGSSLSSRAVSCDITGFPFIWLFASRNLLQTPFSELSRQASRWFEFQIDNNRFSSLVLAEGVRHWNWWVRVVSELCVSLVVLYGGKAFPKTLLGMHQVWSKRCPAGSRLWVRVRRLEVSLVNHDTPNRWRRVWSQSASEV